MKARIGLIAKGDGMVFLLICNFIHTTDYHLGWYKSSSTFANELHALSLSLSLSLLYLALSHVQWFAFHTRHHSFTAQSPSSSTVSFLSFLDLLTTQTERIINYGINLGSDLRTVMSSNSQEKLFSATAQILHQECAVIDEVDGCGKKVLQNGFPRLESPTPTPKPLSLSHPHTQTHSYIHSILSIYLLCLTWWYIIWHMYLTSFLYCHPRYDTITIRLRFPCVTFPYSTLPHTTYL